MELMFDLNREQGTTLVMARTTLVPAPAGGGRAHARRVDLP
jgi:predicted ABC-type transport system involved in lysophospholipase L1 biosynthesis ATPase subunit